MLIKLLVRLAAVISAISIFTGSSRWPESLFVASVLMICIWAHAEWDWKKRQ